MSFMCVNEWMWLNFMCLVHILYYENHNKCPPAFFTDPIFEIEVCWSLEVDNITGSLKKAQSLKNKGNDCFLVHSESIVIGKLGNGCWDT